VGQGEGAGVPEQVQAQRQRLEQRLASVRRVIAIASGKGGVGKSAVTANVAAALAARGRRVGAVDADLNGPSLARMLGVPPNPLAIGAEGVQPAVGVAGVRVISMDVLLAGDDAPVRWKDAGDGAEFVRQSAIETSALREFLADIAWGELDYLLIDVPPGTDKLGRVLELVPRLTAVLLVTTPSEMARHVVAKSVRQAREAGVPAVALVANMTAYVCERCGHSSVLFAADGARRLAAAAGVPLWAEIPFDPRLGLATDRGEPPVLGEEDYAAARAMHELAGHIEQELTEGVPQ
jgi:ATP-binding protein involved in chromosome partitioning